MNAAANLTDDSFCVSISQFLSNKKKETIIGAVERIKESL